MYFSACSYVTCTLRARTEQTVSGFFLGEKGKGRSNVIGTLFKANIYFLLMNLRNHKIYPYNCQRDVTSIELGVERGETINVYMYM